MHTQQQLLDSARAAQGGISDYRLAQLMEVTRNSISEVRTGRRPLSQPQGLRLARLANLEPAYVLACIEAANAARHDLPGIYETWAHLADRLRGAAVMLSAVIVSAALLHPTEARGSVPHYVKHIFPALSIHYAKSGFAEISVTYSRAFTTLRNICGSFCGTLSFCHWGIAWAH